MEKLIEALQRLIQLLKESEDSIWSTDSVAELIQQLEEELHKAQNSQPIDKNRLSYLFLPTGSLQETSIDNGWGDEFVRFSRIVDEYIS